jgi:hypothetical protein
VSGRESWHGLAENDGGVDVQLLTHCHVPRDMARLRNGGEENA